MIRFISLLNILALSMHMLVPMAQAASGESIANTIYVPQDITISSTKALSIQPGTTIQLSGNNFGTTAPKDIQLCLNLTHCTESGYFYPLIVSWSNTSISFEIPDGEFPSQGRLFVHFPNIHTLVEGPMYTFTRPLPNIQSITPSTIIPYQTRIQITGTGFGSTLSKETKICVPSEGQDLCLLDQGMEQANIEWSDTTITFTLPYYPDTPSTSIVLYIKRYTSRTGQTLLSRVISPTVTIPVANDPVITSISPVRVIPGTSLITIKGEHFGQNYLPGTNQICIPDGCITDESIPHVLKKWSDTEIIFTAPDFLMKYNKTKFSLRLFFPSKGNAEILTYPTEFTIVPKPFITAYYPTMENGKSYTVQGYGFGNNQGQVLLDTAQAIIVNWSDTFITFIAPELPSKQSTLQVVSAQDIPSDGIEVTLEYIKKYSNDALSGYQWYFSLLQMEEAWKITQGTQETIVAILDSGIDNNHEDLRDALWTNTKEIPNNGKDDDQNGYIDDIHGWNTVSNSGDVTPINGHGTLVASIIAAKKDNALGIAGIAPKVKLMSVVVTARGDSVIKEDHIEYDSVFRAVQYAVKNGARIINMSFGAEAPLGFYTKIMQYAYDNNVLLVVSSGNNNSNLDVVSTSPACDDGNANIVLGIASLDKLLKKADFSNYGVRCIDLAVPGEDIIGAALSNTGVDVSFPYLKAAGTSFSAPIVSGAAALLLSIHPTWNVEEIKQALLSASTPISEQPQLGKGYLNIEKLLLSQRPNVQYQGNPENQLKLEEKELIITIKEPTFTPITPIQPVERGPGTQFEANSSTNTLKPSPFSDVASTHKNLSAILYLKEKKVIQGYANGTFQPNKAINRAEFLKMLFEGQQVTIPDSYKNCFSDVREQWFAKYVCYAKAKGMVEGYRQKNGTSLFKPDQTINKAEATKMLITTFNIPISTTFLSSFTDIPASAWYNPYITSAEKLGLVEEKGKTSIYAPGTSMVRASISEMLYRIMWVREKGLNTFPNL